MHAVYLGSMPKYVYLLRHAQSAERQGSQPDELRELTTHGSWQAEQIGIFLRNNKKNPDIICSSPAIRAHQTALNVVKQIDYDTGKIELVESIYNLTVDAFFDLIASIDNILSHLMIVGHNPMISYIADFLINGKTGNMSPATLAIIEFDTTTWQEVSQGVGTLVSFVSPEHIND